MSFKQRFLKVVSIISGKKINTGESLNVGDQTIPIKTPPLRPTESILFYRLRVDRGIFEIRRMYKKQNKTYYVIYSSELDKEFNTTSELFESLFEELLIQDTSIIK